MKITGIISNGKIVIPLEVLKELGFKEGERVILECKKKLRTMGKSAKKDLFGALKGTVKIKGDIISPINEDWEALS